MAEDRGAANGSKTEGEGTGLPDRLIAPPNPRQREFFLARSRFVAYGGARGGGKSWAVRKKATLMGVRYPGIRMLLLRRTFPELKENHILPLQGELKGLAAYKEGDKAFSFANGSRLKFGYCDSERDVLQYQGQEYDVIFLDEATQFTEYQFHTLTACIRGANPFPKRMYLTCNPGGVGHGWVKRLFIDRDYRGAERGEDYAFIPARVYDNRALMDSDPGYLAMLESLPDDLRRAWLEGDWNVFAGQYFTEWREDIHVCDPFPIPGHWRRYFAMDYGLDMLAGYFIALDEGGRAWVYRELYRPGLIVSEAARAILEAAGGEPIEGWLAPPDMWNRRQDTGKSVAEIFGEGGIPLTRAQNSRVSGWMDLREWLRPRGEPGARWAALTVFRCCPNLIRCLPQLQFDGRRPSDAAGQPHEITHAPDALRYFAAGRPAPALPPREGEGDPPGGELGDFLHYGG